MSSNLNMPVDLQQQAEQFLFAEAELLDNWQLEEWLNLFTGDCRYWVPSNGNNYDPETESSLIYVGRVELGDMVGRLLSPDIRCQVPRAQTTRIIGNIRVEPADEHELTLKSNFILCETRLNRERLLGGNYQHNIRIEDGLWRISMKKAALVSNGRPLTGLSILP